MEIDAALVGIVVAQSVGLISLFLRLRASQKTREAQAESTTADSLGKVSNQIPDLLEKFTNLLEAANVDRDHVRDILEQERTENTRTLMELTFKVNNLSHDLDIERNLRQKEVSLLDQQLSQERQLRSEEKQSSSKLQIRLETELGLLAQISNDRQTLLEQALSDNKSLRNLLQERETS